MEVTKVRGFLDIFFKNLTNFSEKTCQDRIFCFLCLFSAIYAFNFAVMLFLLFMLLKN